MGIFDDFEYKENYQNENDFVQGNKVEITNIYMKGLE